MRTADPLDTPMHRVRAADRRVWLDALYDRYTDRRHITRDPIVVVYRYEDAAEREIVALLAALLSYGNVPSILRGIDTLLDRLDHVPRKYLLASSVDAIRRDLRGWRYRVTSDTDMAALLIGIKRTLEAHGTLEAAFAANASPDDTTVLPALEQWTASVAHAANHPLNHLLPNPSRGSACKRLHMFLRWMVRRDAVDPGGWDAIEPRQLIVPLDTHMHAMARRLRLTRRKQANGATALAITEALRRVHPTDPVRYDFALTRPGILGVAQK